MVPPHSPSVLQCHKLSIARTSQADDLASEEHSSAILALTANDSFPISSSTGTRTVSDYPERVACS